MISLNLNNSEDPRHVPQNLSTSQSLESHSGNNYKASENLLRVPRRDRSCAARNATRLQLSGAHKLHTLHTKQPPKRLVAAQSETRDRKHVCRHHPS